MASKINELQIPTGFEDLEFEEQFDYVDRIWRAILRSKTSLPYPDWQAKIVRARAEALDTNPEIAMSRQEARAYIAARRKQNGDG